MKEWLSEGPFTLTMSAGFFGFFAHTGFLSVLEDEGIIPARVSGSSAGALVTGLWASGRSASALRDMLAALKRQDFWDPSPGAGLLKGRKFRQKLMDELDVQRFSECRVPLAITVFDVMRRKERVITEGPLAPAIHASCTFPGLFHPVRLDGRSYIDGGVTDRAGLAGVPDGERVLYHHLSTRSKIRGRLKKLSWYPRRDGMLPIVVQGLPAVGPFKLHRGMSAYDVAARALQEAMHRPIAEPGGDPHVLG